MDEGFGGRVGSHGARLEVAEWRDWESYSLGYWSYDHILNITELDIKGGLIYLTCEMACYAKERRALCLVWRFCA